MKERSTNLEAATEEGQRPGEAFEKINAGAIKKPVKKYSEKSILEEPEPPKKEAKEGELGGKNKEQDESMEISEEDENTPQELTDTTLDKDKVELGKRTFEFVHPVLNYEGTKRSGVEMVLSKEVRDILSQLQVKVNQLEEKAKTHDEQVQVLEKRIHELEGERSEILKKVEGLDETVEDKSREFGEQARLAVSKTHKAQEAAEEAKAQADRVSNKVKDIEKKYEDNLGKFAVAIDNRFEKRKGELKDEYAQFTKQTEDLKKEFAVAINKVKQAEEKVITTANTSKQVSTKLAIEIESLKHSSWLMAASRKKIEVIATKATTKATQPEPQKETYRIRILDPTELKEKRAVKIEDYADNLCTKYQDEKPAVKRIWRSESGNITIITESKKVYDERDKWVKNLNPVFQIIQEEDWPKLVVKGIRTGTPENVVKEDLEESLGVKFRVNPIRIGTDHSTLGDTYVLAFRSEEDRYDALTRDPIVRYNRLRLFDYKPRPRRRSEGNRGPPRGPARSSYEDYRRMKAAAGLLDY